MSIQSNDDLQSLEEIGRIVAEALELLRDNTVAGITTGELDSLCLSHLRRHDARPSPHHHFGFPGAVCISLNEEAVHGIPGRRKIAPGDLVKLDVTAEKNGYIADAAITIGVEPTCLRHQQLIDCARSALEEAIGMVRPGRYVREIGRTVQGHVKRHGFSVLRDLAGHGTGRAIWEEPSVPNYPDRSNHARLTEGLVFTIEPIISAGSALVRTEPDGWTLSTTDGSLAAHFEHTLAIVDGYPRILTAVSAH